MNHRVCHACGHLAPCLWLPDSNRWLCGLCAHRLAIAKDLARRIARVKGAA